MIKFLPLQVNYQEFALGNYCLGGDNFLLLGLGIIFRTKNVIRYGLGLPFFEYEYNNF